MLTTPLDHELATGNPLQMPIPMQVRRIASEVSEINDRRTIMVFGMVPTNTSQRSSSPSVWRRLRR